MAGACSACGGSEAPDSFRISSPSSPLAKHVKSFLLPVLLCMLAACSSPAPAAPGSNQPIGADAVTLFVAGLSCPN